MKKLIALLLAGVMAISLTACGGQESSGTTAAADGGGTTAEADGGDDTAAANDGGSAAAGDAVYTIGLAAMLTGDNALNGERMQKSTEMAISQYNEAAGYEKFVLRVEDDMTTTEGALTAVQHLISDGCLAIVGPHRSSNALAVSETAQENEVSILVGGTAVSIDGSNPYMFRARASDSIMAEVAASFAGETLGAQKIGVMHASDEYGQGGADTVFAYCEENGIEYVDEPHNVNDVDFTNAILDLQTQGVDTVVVWTHDAELAIIAQQLNTYLPDVQVVSSPGATLDNVLNLCEADWVDGWYSVTDFISGADETVVQEFVAAYEEMYGETPDLYAAAYYGAAVTILEAVLAAEEAGEVTSQTVRDQIAATSGLELPTGTFTCDDVNDLVHSCVIAELDGLTPVYYDSVSVE